MDDPLAKIGLNLHSKQNFMLTWSKSMTHSLAFPLKNRNEKNQLDPKLVLQ